MHHNIPIGEQLSMVLRRVPLRLIKDGIRRCDEAGVTVSHRYFEAHHLCGGDIEDLVDGIVFSQINNLTISMEHLAARQIYEQIEGGRPLEVNLSEFLAAGIYDLDEQPLALHDS